ncbi:hypothetical protein Q7P35_009426 [Cladosporium inversicolor]
MLHTKIFVAFAICFAVFVLGQDNIDPDFVCPAEDIAATQCTGPRDCLYPNSKSCTTYIACEALEDGVTAVAHVGKCDAGLEWNDREKKCDFPANSTCPK